MAMEQIGYVVDKNAEIITVRVMRESACGGNCVSCKGCPSDAVLVTCADDSQNPYAIGEEVLVLMETSRFVLGTFGSFGLLTAWILAGGIVGYYFIQTEVSSVIGAVAGLFLGTCFMKILFKKHTTNLKIKRRK